MNRHLDDLHWRQRETGISDAVRAFLFQSRPFCKVFVDIRLVNFHFSCINKIFFQINWKVLPFSFKYFCGIFNAYVLLTVTFFFFLIIYLFEGEGRGERERKKEKRKKGKKKETSIRCSTYWCIHWLILVRALTGDRICNPDILKQHSNQLSYRSRAAGIF